MASVKRLNLSAEPSPAPTAAESEALRAARERFVGFWGEMAPRWGINRTMAQIHALLYVSEEPLDTEEIMESLGISPERLLEYPHQMSGGMRQRIMIGMGLILSPDLLIADEPTTSLDVIVEAQFLDLLNALRKEFDLTILLITHNLGVVAQLADRITVMYGGRIAETGPAEAIFGDPLHPYTQGLLASIPNIRLDQPELKAMPGSPPDLVDPPQGCVFHPRCPRVKEICTQQRPSTFSKDGRLVRCWLYG